MHRFAALALAVLVTGAAACGAATDPSAALARGLAAQRAGDLEGAREAYLEVLETEPRNRYALYDLGTVEQAAGRPELAEGYYRQALDVDPRMEGALFNLALLRTGAGATQEAIDLYRRVIQVNGQNARAHFNLGQLLEAAGQRDAAVAEIEAAIALDPSLLGDDTPSPMPVDTP